MVKRIYIETDRTKHHVATHEAGHAVIMARYGMRTDPDIWMQADGLWSGWCIYKACSGLPANWHVLMGVAGTLAEFMRFHCSTPERFIDDPQRVFEWLLKTDQSEPDARNMRGMTVDDVRAAMVLLVDVWSLLLKTAQLLMTHPLDHDPRDTLPTDDC